MIKMNYLSFRCSSWQQRNHAVPHNHHRQNALPIDVSLTGEMIFVSDTRCQMLQAFSSTYKRRIQIECLFVYGSGLRRASVSIKLMPNLAIMGNFRLVH